MVVFLRRKPFDPSAEALVVSLPVHLSQLRHAGLAATYFGFRNPRVVLLPIVQDVPVRGFVDPHAETGVEKLPFFALPVCGKLDVFPVHAGKVPVRAAHGGPRPQDL